MYSVDKLNRIFREYGAFLGGISTVHLAVKDEPQTVGCVFADGKWLVAPDAENRISVNGWRGQEDFFASKGLPPKHGTELAVVTFHGGTVFRFPCYELSEGEEYPDCGEDALYKLQAERCFGKEHFAEMLSKTKTMFGNGGR